MGSMDDDAGLTPLAKAMRSSKRPHKVVNFPGLPGTKVAIVNPCDEELAEAQAAAAQYILRGLKMSEFEFSVLVERNLYQAEEQRQILARVLRDPADVDSSFGTIDELREHLTPKTREVLMRHLAEFVDERSPEKRFNGDPKEVADFIASLKGEGALSEWLTSCDFATATFIARSLAEALPMLTKPSSSDTSSSNSPNDGSSG